MQPHHIRWFPVPLKAALLSSLGPAAMLSEVGLLVPPPSHFFLVPTQCSALRSLEKIPSVLHGDKGSWGRERCAGCSPLFQKARLNPQDLPSWEFFLGDSPPSPLDPGFLLNLINNGVIICLLLMRVD